jgi:hypothetical protein
VEFYAPWWVEIISTLNKTCLFPRTWSWFLWNIAISLITDFVHLKQMVPWIAWWCIFFKHHYFMIWLFIVYFYYGAFCCQGSNLIWKSHIHILTIKIA